MLRTQMGLKRLIRGLCCHMLGLRLCNLYLCTQAVMEHCFFPSITLKDIHPSIHPMDFRLVIRYSRLEQDCNFTADEMQSVSNIEFVCNTFEMNTSIQQGHLLKVTVKAFQIISVLKQTFYSSNHSKKNITISTKILCSTTVFNIDNNQNFI